MVTSVVILVCLLPTFVEAALLQYLFRVAYFSGAPDGVTQPKILGINNQFPGPTIRARVGDTLEITLVNVIQDRQPTTLHWHGIRQEGSQFEDGTNQISQCPLPYGQSQIYRFNVSAAGTYWYHSHYRSQYTEGLFGALIVDAEKSAYQSADEFTILLSDWYHQSAKENEEWYLSPGRHSAPYPNSGLLNGLGRYPCNLAPAQNRSCNPNLQYRPVFKVMRAFTYRIRILNCAAFASFNFSIDGHRLKIVEMDGIDVGSSPTVDVLSIAPGQRYSILVTPRNTGRFLIRAPIRKEHMVLFPENNINRFPESLIGNLTAVLNVVNFDPGNPKSRAVVVSNEKFRFDQIVPQVHNRPDEIVVLDDMMLAPLDGIPAPDPVTKAFTVYTSLVADEKNVSRATMNGTIFRLPTHKPILMSFLQDGLLPNHTVVLEVKFGDVVQLVLNNPQEIPHPFHLHGHHFWVVGLGKPWEGQYKSGHHNITLRGPRRDTVVVQENSWMVIRFVADNPGIWVFHCHFDWHNLGGMKLLVVEAGDVLRNSLRVTDEARRICKLNGVAI